MSRGVLWRIGLVALALAAGFAGPSSAGAQADEAPPALPAGARVVKDGWFRAPAPKIPRPALPAKIKTAYVIPIHGTINGALYEIVRRKVTICKGRGAKLVIFDLDTPGGASDAMEKIIQLIFNDLHDVYTVAYVHPKAFSAGALISLACTEIVVAPDGRIGAAVGWIPGIELPKAVRAKFDAASRSQVRAWAKQRGQWPAVWEAMVSVEAEVWVIRKTATDELRLVEASDWQALREEEDSKRTRRLAEPPEPGWEYVRMIDSDEDVLSCDADRALELGVATREVEDLAALKAHYHVEALQTLGDTWSERMVAFLSLPIVTTLLVVVGLMAFYSETRMPGLGFPAVIAVICFAILLGSQYLIGMANWWEIALVCVGLGLIALEVFVIPGFGVAGISGILCCIVGGLALLVANAPNELPLPRTELDWSLLSRGALSLALGVIGAMIGGALLSRYLPKLPLGSRLVLAPAEGGAEDLLPSDAPVRRVQVGDVGVVEGMCRPVGKVRFGDALVDASTEGDTLEPGTKVRVLRRSGNRVVVERT